ncbi:MAG TPA: hypothetical protein VHZ81_02580 [Galbitalea sp.]|jgi:hypothetical protein|nr:hypothetical protein [Galbitalea sp.]
MGKILLLVVGVAAGFVIAHQVSKTQAGRQFFDDVDSRAKDFSSALVDGFNARANDVRRSVADAQDAVDGLGDL